MLVYSGGSWLSLGLKFISWPSSVQLNKISHDIHLCVVFLTNLLFSCCTVSSFWEEMFYVTNVAWMQPKKGEKWQLPIEKGSGKKGHFLHKKQKDASSRMTCQFDLQLLPPRVVQLVFEVDWPPGVKSSEKAPTNTDLQASAVQPGDPSVMQSVLVRHQTTDVASCWLHLTHQPLTLPPHGLKLIQKLKWNTQRHECTCTHGCMAEQKSRTFFGCLFTGKETTSGPSP